jgi:hypothetical protein
LSLERFSGVLEQVFAAPSHADLEAAMLALPPLVRLTPASRQLAKPLVLRAADGGLQLGSGWQLAADTTRSHRRQLGHPSDQPPPGDLGFDRGSRPRGSGRADSQRIRTRPARVAVSTRPRRAGVADFHIRTNRGDPDTPPQGAQRRAVHALEATAHRRRPKLGR